MLTLRLPSLSSLPLSSSRHLLRLQPSLSFSRPLSIAMSSSAVEHVVLFKVRDGVDSSKVSDMLAGLNGLSSLPGVLHLTAGAVHRLRSSSLHFTHLLHSRYRSKDDLAAYSASPSHMSVVKESVLPICDDIMAVDWIADGFRGPLTAAAGAAIRATFLKLKENAGEEAKSEVMEAIRGMEEKLGHNVQLTVGENFSPARAKGYSVASIAVFPGLGELEAAESDREMVELHKEKVREHLESVIVVDYVVPSPPSPSL